jgi:3-dehydroquinate dehydratase / shikimate dehydrogenase
MSELFRTGKICAVVAERDAAAMARELRRALRVSKTVELRLDWLRSAGEIERMIQWLAANRKRLGAASRVTLIATCRRRGAGGEFAGGVREELEFLRGAAAAGCRWVDLEIESAEWMGPEEVQALRRVARVLISYHNFRRTLPNLRNVRNRVESARGDAIKIAAEARGLRDGLRILKLARTSRRVVAVPMGEMAAAARILALRAGSALAYASVGEATAPGQISFEEMTSLYRADRLTRRTRIYAVIGDPIGHSLSPQLQNAGFRARRMDAVYVPVLVRDLRDFLAAIGPLGIAGFSVTLPHKEAILRHLDDCDPLAAEIGAVNTVVVRGGGELYGYNTDYVGVLRALEGSGTRSHEDPTRKTGGWGTPRFASRIAGRRVLLLGAGGSARAVAFALARGGANVCVCARRISRARALARAVGGEAIERRVLRGEFFDAIVNATPVGMFPRVAESPLSVAELNCRLVFDLIYRPRVTKLLRLAAARGIETVSGLEMFVAQGTAQWEIWTGERAPVREMSAAVEDVE